jgi:ubiquinol-cytochrome c reductase cytochrome c subunit
MLAAILSAAGSLILWTQPSAQGHAGKPNVRSAAATKLPDAPGPKDLTVATPTSPELISQGHQIYDQSCASCHGLNLQGRRETAPSLRGVGAGPLGFYLSTGRMPLANPRAEPERGTPAFNSRQINAVIAFVRHIGHGPPGPTANPSSGDIALGFKLFDENCAGCHSIVARGGITLGAEVPGLQQSSARQIAEAVRAGPYLMPRFDAQQLDQHDLDALARYVLWTRHPDDAGGWGIYNIGPIPEGIVAWFLGLLALVIVARLIGERTQ